MEKQEKNYKTYFINRYTYKTTNKINALKKLLKVNKQNADDFDTWYYGEILTPKQAELLRTNNFKKLKELLKNQIEREKEKLTKEKAEALKEYNKIKEQKDIKILVINIMWSNGRRSMGAYQTMASASVEYQNNTGEFYDTNYTGGCGYDKPSTSAGEVCNKLAKIVLLKHYNKIQNDKDKHYHFYAAENGYFQHGVGLNSYETFFKNCGYKVKRTYHSNENETLVITK